MDYHMDYACITPTEQSFGDAVQAVEAAITTAGMQVLHIHDVQETLAKRGFQREPFKIVEFCNAQFANDFLKLDIRVGLCLPCKINVYTDQGQTWIAGLRPTILPLVFPDVPFGEKLGEIDQIIQRIVTSAASAPVQKAHHQS